MLNLSLVYFPVKSKAWISATYNWMYYYTYLANLYVYILQ